MKGINVGWLWIVVLLGFIVLADARMGASLQNDLDVVREDLSSSLDREQSLQDQVAGLNDELTAADEERNRLEGELGRYEYLVCQNHDWYDAMRAGGKLSSIEDDTHQLPSDFELFVFFTQWDPRFNGEWVEGLPITTLFLDLEREASVIFDAEENCVIIDPLWWNSLDRSPRGSARLIKN